MKNWEPPIYNADDFKREVKVVKQRETRTAAYIFDIDGTVADHSRRLPLIDKTREGGPDWALFHDECHLDPPILAMCRLARSLHYASVPIIFMTGRMEFQREKTVRWLGEHVSTGWFSERGPYQGFEPMTINEHLGCKWQPKGVMPWLMMRAEGDKREDTFVKGEMLDMVEKYIEVYAPHMYVAMAFEDRPRICDLWRSRGLTVAKIGTWEEVQQKPEGEAWAGRYKELEQALEPMPVSTASGFRG